MEFKEMPQEQPKNDSLTAEDIAEVKKLNEQINNLSLQASKIVQKMSEPSLSSEKILELEEEKARIYDQVRVLSQKRLAFNDKYLKSKK